MEYTTTEAKIVMKSIENIIDYMLINCDMDGVKREYSEDKNRLNGIQIALDTSNPDDTMEIDISIE